ncbi:MAG: hypothetical protein A3B99_02815 [Candidatus Yanofskybacteria bacterium RIFCSPHIGHO2_02_FULL_44_12b]|nr:MAG: hypothetical protein A3B99_02815 [Candidatus Yanofskybacteria bacterium RIFCSPHIGHO2_02_FULL_44_12b]
MRKFLHIFIKTVSLAGLVLVVFLMNAYTAVFKKSAKDEGGERLFPNDFSINFSTNKAFADAPSGSSEEGSTDEGEGSSGSSK